MKLPKAYEPADYEANIYSLWEQSGAFTPKNRGNDQTFSLVAPPPNANAKLHIGYGLVVAIEDTLARYHRMQGKATLFVPGADHAGFETWVVYEKKLAAEGISRFDFSREALYGQVWDFVQANKHNFESQLRALGASYDWSAFTFTLDSKVVEQAYKTFKSMWDDGLIYRGKRIVNYCTFHGTSFSDIEVVHEPEKTKLWHIAYALAGGEGEVVIATTRPETKLGQAALMVNPKDKRYKHLIGKEVNQPLVPGRPIKIIGDEYVDMDFGTGVVTVTPGHDTNDFEVAQRHKLPVIELITTEGKMSDNVPQEFRGLSVLEAREAVEKALKEKGCLRKVEDYLHSVAKCYKCGTVIEPLVRDQWFVKMTELAKPAIEALENKKVTFTPDSKRSQVIRYLKEVKDWNISRQIAWGIPIPAFQNVDKPEDWIFDARVDQEEIEVDGQRYRRDPDVFDTWFSSGQWPYVTLNYPDGELYKKFYPLNLMETGGEILYQWVARMIMLGLYTTSEVPFKHVYIHGYVLAEDGAKMSKSLGNTVDPFELIHKYGSDALRMGLLAGRRPGVNQGYHPAKIIGGRNFANKLWNVARFIEDKVGDKHERRYEAAPQTLADHWIVSRFNVAQAEMTKALENYRLSEAYEALTRFVWSELADWYLEAQKVDTNELMLAQMLDNTLKLAHPFAPFVTESIWQTLSWEKENLLAVQPWPKNIQASREEAVKFDEVIGLVSEVRQIITALKASKPSLYFKGSLLAEQGTLVAKLANLKAVKPLIKPIDGVRLAGTKAEVWLDIDKAKAAHYIKELEERLRATTEVNSRLEDRLGNTAYIQKAPAELVNQTKSELKETGKLLQKIEAEIASFKEMSS